MSKVTTKLLLLLYTLVTALLTTPKAQTQDGTIRLRSSKYVAKNIGGKEHDTDAVPSPDKTILVDFSATQYDPCWALHKLDILGKTREIFGPDGANQVGVLWVEAPGELLETIYRGVNRFRDQPTKGGWRENKDGEPIPHPIISDQQLAATVLGRAILSFLTFVLMRPDRR